MSPLGPVLASLVLAAGAEAAKNEEKVVIAVFPLQDAAELLSPMAENGLIDYFGAKLAESSRFVIVPRSDIEAALAAEKAESYKACYDQSCQIEIGKELAAQKVVRTQILKVGDSCAVAATLYDLRMAAAESAATERGGCTENALVESIEAVARRLTGAPAASAAPSAPPAATSAPTFTLRVGAEPAEADVLVDGRSRGTGAGVRVALEPGVPHELVVEAEGYLPHRETVTLERDERRTVRLRMTSATRATRTEWFGVSLAGGMLTSGGWTTGLWMRIANLNFGLLQWSVVDAYVGFVGSRRTLTLYELDVEEGDCTAAQIEADGYCRMGATGVAGFFGTRLGAGFALDEAGAHRLDVGAAVGAYAISDTDDSITALAVAPNVQYRRVSEGAFVWGVGLRALIPVTGREACAFGVTGGGSTLFQEYTECQNASPYMIQLEVPLGWYF